MKDEKLVEFGVIVENYYEWEDGGGYWTTDDNSLHDSKRDAIDYYNAQNKCAECGHKPFAEHRKRGKIRIRKIYAEKIK